MGRRVLVTGAGSGVATFAVQIAAAIGSEVWVTTSSEAKLSRLRELGARGGVVYLQRDWGLKLREAPGAGFDAAIDSWGAEGWADVLRSLRRGGVLVSFGDTGWEWSVGRVRSRSRRGDNTAGERVLVGSAGERFGGCG